MLAHGIRMQKNPKTKADIFWLSIYYWMYLLISKQDDLSM